MRDLRGFEARVRGCVVLGLTCRQAESELCLPIFIGTQRTYLYVCRQRHIGNSLGRQYGPILERVTALAKRFNRPAAFVDAPRECRVPHRGLAAENVLEGARPAIFIAGLRRAIEDQDVAEIIAGIRGRTHGEKAVVLRDD
jgi:hypothetical protein